MKLIILDKKDCPYCDISLEIKGDSDRSLFNWHLNGHDIVKEWYDTNDAIEKLIQDYAHDFRSKSYDEDIMAVALRDFYKRSREVSRDTQEIIDLKNYIEALEYKIEAMEIEYNAEITSRGIDNTNN